TWKSFHPNGKVKYERTFKNNYEHGPAKHYYEDGTLKCEGQFVSGRMNGTWKYYNEKGKLTHKQTYRNGELITPKQDIKNKTSPAQKK
ncbi:MAG: hypothetical protein NZ529_09420, partial [Cytophagaceae bacterium]|nr:hypothetical protein [Cytophagaceae bacterium]MDW8457004.1 hypothetical protein [Cytophagaceae bacterium]